MSKKAKYNWNQPSLFQDGNPHPSDRELQGYKIVTNKNGVTQRLAIIRRTKEDFIRKSQAIWGDQYDYSETVYTGSKSPVIIRCKKHNYYFTVSIAQNHYMKPHGTYRPTGCPVCRAEETHKCEYGNDWHKYLKLCAKNNRVGCIVRQPSKKKGSLKPLTPEEKAARRAQLVEEQRIRSHQKACYDFRTRLVGKYGDQYTFKDEDYRGSDRSMTFHCKYHGEFTVEPRELITDRTDGRHSHRECPVCEGREVPKRMTVDEFFRRMRQLYGASELDFLTSEYKGMHENVTAYCRKHGAITHPAKYWLDGKGCEYCNGKFYPPDFLQMARKAQGQEYTYRSLNKIVSMASRVMVHCGNPNHSWHRMLVSLVLQGCKCRECAGRHQPVEQRCQEWIDKCIEKYGEGRYDYSRAHEDYVNNDSLVWIRCCIHDHWFQQTPDNNLRTVNGSCPICSMELRESEGEATIRRWLQKHGILDFEQEYQLPNEDPTLPLQYLSADFYLHYGRDYIIIEYHGEQHYEDVPYFYEGRTRNFAVQQHRDRYLRQYCHDHQIKLLEIPYTDFKRIDEILSAYFEPKTE